MAVLVFKFFVSQYIIDKGIVMCNDVFEVKLLLS